MALWLTLILSTCLTSLFGFSHGSCPIQGETDIIVYADLSGGVGPHSDTWTRAFFAWWQSGNPNLKVAYATSAREISTECTLSDLKMFPSLKLYVQPGGDAANQSVALGPAGRDNILNFAAAHGAYMGTCAGYFYGTGSWWWYGDFFPQVCISFHFFFFT